ncbi:MAG TPA: YaiI/YqxD family protein [Planctomycetota bacterium]|nr:YaiI/YqxD family protein [Planctomycetota bacterium]HRR78660.1 YaiI/YqxD family protein [Planctomycetota bacterium]HRT97310.1 YaiI/YqxD family protein [Planctomycetota bacterium]
MPPTIWIDADGCPNEVKQVVFRASDRLRLAVQLVANVPLATPRWPLVTLALVSHDFNAADDHIAAHAAAGDVVITADIPLAARVVEKGAVAINPRGETYDTANVGRHLATRDLMQDLRAAGAIQGGPAPIRPADKARFAAALDRALTRALKAAPPPSP